LNPGLDHETISVAIAGENLEPTDYMQPQPSLELHLKRLRVATLLLRRQPIRLAATAILLAATALALNGCDRRPTEPTAATSGSPAIPTTQELINGPRTDLALHTAPLRLSVPRSWKLDLAATSTTLRGLTPHGSVQIIIAFRTTFTHDKEQFLIGAFQDKGASEGYRHVKLRSSAGIDIVELQKVTAPIDTPLLNNQGNKLKDTSEPLEWKFLAFIPEGSQPGEFDEYEIAFFNLDESLYQADKDFLESIMGTLKYDPAAGDGS
jgi:hypothetical protein